MSASITASGVVVDKPWYLSKKIWLCVIALVLAVVQSATGHWTDATSPDVARRIAESASYLLPLLGTILALAHVDAHARGAALIADAFKAAAAIDQPDDVAAPNTSTNPS